MNLFTFNFKLFIFIFFITICVCLITTLFLIESHLRENLKAHKNVESYKYLFLNGNADWIALGDSHTARSLLNTSWLDNLGFAGDNLETLQQKASYRINRRKPLGIILPVSPQIFSFYRLADNQKDRIDNLISYKKYFFNFLNPIYRQYLVSLAKLVYKNKLESIFNIKNTSIKNIQWIDMPIKKRINQTSIRVQLHTPIRNFNKHHSYYKYKGMVKTYLESGIRLCFVKYPLSSLYLNQTRELSEFKKVNDIFKKLAQEQNINFVDLSDILSNDKFTDPDHIKSKYKNLITNLVKKGCKVKDL